jgi:uncharacterized protein YegP (UPF0339 family)
MGKFVVKKTATGVKFDEKAGNGEVILTSEVYTSKAACLKGVNSVKKNAPTAPVEDQTEEGHKTFSNPKFEIYVDKAGEFRFRLRARNGKSVGHSEGYTAMAGCKNGIESVRANADSEITFEE